MELPFKLEACPPISEDDRRKCLISGETVPFLMQMGHAEEPLVFCEIETQSSCRKHANQASCELQFSRYLKWIGILAKYWQRARYPISKSVPLSILYSNWRQETPYAISSCRHI